MPTNRARRRPTEQTNEEVLFDLLLQMASDLRALKTLAYWFAGVSAVATLIVFVVVAGG